MLLGRLNGLLQVGQIRLSALDLIDQHRELPFQFVEQQSVVAQRPAVFPAHQLGQLAGLEQGLGHVGPEPHFLVLHHHFLGDLQVGQQLRFLRGQLRRVLEEPHHHSHLFRWHVLVFPQFFAVPQVLVQRGFEIGADFRVVRHREQLPQSLFVAVGKRFFEVHWERLADFQVRGPSHQIVPQPVGHTACGLQHHVGHIRRVGVGLAGGRYLELAQVMRTVHLEQVNHLPRLQTGRIGRFHAESHVLGIRIDAFPLAIAPDAATKGEHLLQVHLELVHLALQLGDLLVALEDGLFVFFVRGAPRVPRLQRAHGQVRQRHRRRQQEEQKNLAQRAHGTTLAEMSERSALEKKRCLRALAPWADGTLPPPSESPEATSAYKSIIGSRFRHCQVSATTGKLGTATENASGAPAETPRSRQQEHRQPGAWLWYDVCWCNWA